LKFERLEYYVIEEEIGCSTRRNSSSTSSMCETQNGSAKLISKEHVHRKRSRKI
jgi:hypothetical protein